MKALQRLVSIAVYGAGTAVMFAVALRYDSILFSLLGLGVGALFISAVFDG